MKLLNINEFYPEFCYPKSIKKIVELNLTDFDYWYLMEPERAKIRITGLRKRYPNRKLIPFARRDDNDDVACFEVGKKDTVQIIHDFSGEGYEQKGEYSTFWEWFKAAIDEMVYKNDVNE